MPTPQSNDLGNVAALLELVDVQQGVIDRLQQALEEHEQASADRLMLRQMLAHELRTPLAAIIGTLHTLALPRIPQEKAEDFRVRALRQSEQLNELIDDILHLADPHALSINRAPQDTVAVDILVDDVLNQVAAHVPRERVQLELPENTVLRTMPGRVRQILVNLLVNAGKYSPPDAPIQLTVTRLPDRISFEIVDHGPGIPLEKVESLFEAFNRGKGVDAAEGVGLGLYLVRNLVRSLGGTIEILPRDGGGTLARFELPQKRVEDATARVARTSGEPHLYPVR